MSIGIFISAWRKANPQIGCFYTLKLQSLDKISEHMKFLEKHLRRSCVVFGKARISAEERHESNRKRAKAREAIEDVWRETVVKT